MYQVPSDVETLVKTNPAPLLVTVTLAPGMIDPVESVTAPTMVAVPVDDWANRLDAHRAQAKNRRKRIGTKLLTPNTLSMKQGGCQMVVGQAGSLRPIVNRPPAAFASSQGGR